MGDGTKRVSVQQAAAILGISTEATRQRIKRGTLPTERDEDGNVFVLLDADSTHPNTDSTRTNDGGTADSTALTALIESQQNQIEYLRQQLDKEREANRENRRLLAAALERIPPQLEAPQVASESSVTVSEEPGKGEGENPEQRSPKALAWWRRMFGG